MTGTRKDKRGPKAEARGREEGFGEAHRKAVVKALAGGASLTLAAWQIGFHRGTIHYWRNKCPKFDSDCAAAMRDGERPMVVERQSDRHWQLKPQPRNRFSRARMRIFLEHFAATGDATASAAAAGVSRSTVSRYRRVDPAFRAGWDEALAQCYALLEAEAVRQRLAALERIRIGGDKEADIEPEFDRLLALLRDHRKTLAGLPKPSPGLKTWSFEESLDALEKELKAFGIRIAKEEGEEDD